MLFSGCTWRCEHSWEHNDTSFPRRGSFPGTCALLSSGPRFNIKKTSYQYRKYHCGDKTILRPSYLHNGISYTGKMTSLYWTSNGSWCIGIKGEMSGTVCVTFTWDIYIYIWVVYSFCLFCCLFIIVTWWYMWCIVWQVASKRKYRHVW